MVTYIEAISTFYPNYQVSAISNEYADINWGLNPPIAQNVLDAKILEITKNRKIQELSDKCEAAIISGFESSAVGEPHIYDSEAVDQINLIGAVASTAPTPTEPMGYPIYYACRDVATGTKEYHEHSHFQLRQVLADGAQVKLTHLQAFHVKRMMVMSATTIEQIASIE